VQPAARGVLLPTDASERSLAAVQYGIAAAARLGVEARVLRVVEVPDAAPTPPDRLRAERRLLSDIVAGLAGTGQAPTVEVVEGSPAREILAHQRTGDLILIGTRGRSGARGFPFGSVTERVLRYATGPVWVVHPNTVWRAPRSLLVPTDGSASDAAAIDWALALARGLDATVTFLYVMEDLTRLLAMAPYAGRWYEALTADMRVDADRALADASARAQRANVPSQGRVVTGDAGSQVLTEARGHDLLVLPARGDDDPRRGHLGAVSSFVSRRADGPYAIVPPANQSPAVDRTTGDASGTR
jgi:nucleotide-binding universal stress UspA family protein